MEGMLTTTKQALSIVESSTLKDEEIKMLINAGISDLVRQDINASLETTNELVKTAIIMFVKANFGNVDIKEKELAHRTYSLLCANLSLSEAYRVVD